jgi:ketosteroid isomerase-like protein
MPDKDRTNAIADRFFAAVEAGNLDAITAMYHPDVRIWHSRDEADTNIEQSKELLQLFFSRVSDRRYEIVRRHVFEGGFVQEHVTHGTMADGSAMRLPVCFLCHLDAEGRITRIAEYLDSSKSPLKGVVQHQAAA